jgi:hypothetical protein
MIRKILSGPILIVYWGGSIWGFALTTGYLMDHMGWTLTFLSFLLLPIVHYLAPLYAGLADGYWLPLQVSWGTTAVVVISMLTASAVDLFGKPKQKISPFWVDVGKKDVKAYQMYFRTLINHIDVYNHTDWSKSLPYNKERFQKDEAIIINACDSIHDKYGLDQNYLRMFLDLYIFADPCLRERDVDHWVFRVMHRNDIDYFPDPYSLAAALYK